MEQPRTTSGLRTAITAVIVLIIVIGLPIAVMTIPALRWLNPHAR